MDSDAARLRSVSVWTDVEANSGTRESVVEDVLQFTDDIEIPDSGGLGRENAVLQLPVDDAAWSDIREGKVLRAELTDDEVREWRVVEQNKRRHSDGGRIGIVRCESIAYDLKRRTPLLQRVESNRADIDFTILSLTPTEWIDDVILATPGWPSWITRGTVDATDDLSIFVDGMNAARLLDTICEQSRQSDGEPYEWTLRRNGSTDYKIDLLSQRGSVSRTPYVAVRKNVLSARVRSTSKEQVTRVYPRGGGSRTNRATMAAAKWNVDSVSGSTVTLSDPAGGAGPVAFDDQLNGFYLEKAGGGLTEITDSDAGNNNVTVSDASGISSSDLVQVRENASGDQLIYLEHPSDKSTYGLQVGQLDRQDVPAVENLVSDVAAAFCDEDSDSDGLADGWSKVGSPTVTQETTAQFHRHGTASMKVVASDGDGIETSAITVGPTASDPYYVAQAFARAASGTYQVQLVDVTNSTSYPTSDVDAGKNPDTTKWHRHDIQPGVNFDDESTTQMKVRITASGGSATFYVDAGQLTNAKDPASAIFKGRGANRLWQAANEELNRRSSPVTSYDVDAIDLYRTDVDRWPDEKIEPGNTIRVRDPGLSEDVNVRVMGRRRELTRPGSLRLTIDNQRRGLSDRIGRQNIAELGDDNPPESGAEQTQGQSFTVLTDRTADHVSETSGRKWAGESGADKTVDNPQVLDWLTGVNATGLQVGKLADRPNAGTADRFYLATDGGANDEPILYRDDGNNWQQATTADINDALNVGALAALDEIDTTEITDSAVETPKLAAAAVTAAKVSVAQLSAISADVGQLTAGQLQDSDQKFVADLTAALLSVADEQSTPVTRIRLGQLGPDLEEYGLEILDADRKRVVRLDGLGLSTVGSGQIRNNSISLDQLLMTQLPAVMADQGNYFYGAPLTTNTPGDFRTGYANGDLVVGPFMPATDMEVTELLWRTGNTSSEGKVVIYSDNGGFYPGSLIYEGASQSAGSSTDVSETELDLSLVAGRIYWIGLFFQTFSPSATTFDASDTSAPLGTSTNTVLEYPDQIAYKASPGGSLAPNPFTGSAATVGKVPTIKIRRAGGDPAQGGGSSGGSGGAASVTLQAPVLTSVEPTSDSKVVGVLEDQSDDETKWEVAECSGDGCTPTSVVKDVTSNSTGSTGREYTFERTSRSEDTIYNYRARSSDGTSEGTWSNQIQVRTLLSEPTNFRASDAGSGGQVDLSWTNNSSANDDYRVRYRELGTDSWTEETTGSASSTSYSVTGLTDGTEYEFQVRAEKSNNQSVWTDRAVATPTSTSDDVPELNTVKWDAADCQFVIAWSDNASDETGYEVWRTQGSGDPFSDTKVSDLAADTTSDTDGGPAENSGTWTYGVRKKGGSSGDKDSNTVEGVAGSCTEPLF